MRKYYVKNTIVNMKTLQWKTNLLYNFKGENNKNHPENLRGVLMDKNWGGTRRGAGRVSVIKRKYCHFYLSEEEDRLEQQVIAAFKETEATITKELAKELGVRQYEVAERVYNKMIAVREKIINEAIAKLETERDKVKAELQQEKNAE